MAQANIEFVIGAIDDFTKTFDKLDKQISQAYDAAGTLGKGMMVAGAGVAAGLGVAVHTAAEFEAAMDKVGALAGATGGEMDKLRDKALDLGASTSKSASEVAVAMQDLAAKGFDANSVMAAMPGIIAASEASGEDLALTSGVVASALNAWHMEASEASTVADVLAKAANISAAGVNDMGYAFKYAAPVANTLGIGMNELAAATGIMTNAGLDGSQAGTSLRMALLRLVDAPKEATDAMEDMGFSALDAQGNMKPFSQIIGDLNKSMDGMTQAQKAAELATIFGSEAVTGMLAVLDGGQGQFDDFVKKLDNAGGSAKATADVMRDNLQGAMEELGGAAETAQISIGTALTPAIRWLAEAVTGAINAFNSLPQGMQTAIAVGAALTAAFLIVGGFILWIVSLIPGFVAGFTAIATALGTTAGVMAVTIGWILLIIAAIVAIGVALYQAYQHVGWFRDAVNAAWAQIKEWWNAAITWIMDLTKSIMESISAFVKDTLENIRAWWKENGEAIASAAKFYWALVWSHIKVMATLIGGIIRTLFAVIVGIVKIGWGIVRMIFSTGLNIILGLIAVFAKLFTGDFKGALESAKNTAKKIWDSIVKIFKSINLAEIGKDIMRGFIKGITSMKNVVKDSIKKIADSVPEGIKKLLDIHSPSRVLMELGGFTGEGLAIGMINTIKQVTNAAKDVAEAAIPRVPEQQFQAVRRTSGGNDTNANDGQQKTGSAMQQSAEYSFEIPVIVDGREVARATAKFTQEELDRMENDKKRAKGVK